MLLVSFLLLCSPVVACLPRESKLRRPGGYVLSSVKVSDAGNGISAWMSVLVVVTGGECRRAHSLRRFVLSLKA